MNNVNVINYSVNKLLYYNFMENVCNFIKMSYVRYDTNFLQIFTKIFNSYITSIMPYDRYTNILNKQAKKNTINNNNNNNNSNTYNYNISNEHINVLYYKNIEIPKVNDILYINPHNITNVNISINYYPMHNTLTIKCSNEYPK
ncbi:conserved Plasmodium protein, unknown function [Plasmodium reichenowi]|uniref:Uncharacterized protein n=1 Tax=Plasmodium reichenowi TaxID=5854 RepID=A0A2P9D747_PLARE|nr:conserved Plasmodium protein, unknown function [Plasmodium reichenowi]